MALKSPAHITADESREVSHALGQSVSSRTEHGTWKGPRRMPVQHTCSGNRGRHHHPHCGSLCSWGWGSTADSPLRALPTFLATPSADLVTWPSLGSVPSTGELQRITKAAPAHSVYMAGGRVLVFPVAVSGGRGHRGTRDDSSPHRHHTVLLHPHDRLVI